MTQNNTENTKGVNLQMYYTSYITTYQHLEQLQANFAGFFFKEKVI